VPLSSIAGAPDSTTPLLQVQGEEADSSASEDSDEESELPGAGDPPAAAPGASALSGHAQAEALAGRASELANGVASLDVRMRAHACPLLETRYEAAPVPCSMHGRIPTSCFGCMQLDCQGAQTSGQEQQGASGRPKPKKAKCASCCPLSHAASAQRRIPFSSPLFCPLPVLPRMSASVVPLYTCFVQAHVFAFLNCASRACQVARPAQ
jgi:hypothetical protein